MISITKMTTDSAVTASGISTCSNKINHVISASSRERISKGVDYDIEVLGSTTPCIIADLAGDLIACLASQTYVERVFSVYDTLSAGCRNHDKLQMHASLKLNSAVLAE